MFESVFGATVLYGIDSGPMSAECSPSRAPCDQTSARVSWLRYVAAVPIQRSRVLHSCGLQRHIQPQPVSMQRESCLCRCWRHAACGPPGTDSALQKRSERNNLIRLFLATASLMFCLCHSRECAIESLVPLQGMCC